MRRVPESTYRVQVRAEFDLYAVAALVPYLDALGVGWLYLSPLLQAEPGSAHGYDVTDPTAIDADRGGAEGLDAVAHAAREAGLGILIDIVPNHLGVASPKLNAWWWDLLSHGRTAAHADAFDVDWEAGGGKVRIPVLGDGEDVGGSVRIEDGELAYHEHRFPIADGTAEDGADAATVHARQHYELINWRRADTDLNYRRFFAVNSLAGLRVEAPDVFDGAHQEIRRWFRDGLADGLRVDHPDGLYDPRAYLEALADLSGDAYTLIEKILEPGEELPGGWKSAGTTGYDALGDFDRVLTDPDGERVLTEVDDESRGHHTDWAALAAEGKRQVADGILHSEVLRLVRELQRVPQLAQHDPAALTDAATDLLVAFPVYRSYLPSGLGHLHAARDSAMSAHPQRRETIDRVAAVLADPGEPAAMRFQQTSGMVMAKGVEDTAFYRYPRLTSLTEVGGDPGVFSVTPDEFHQRQRRRLETFPATMTTLSTHDTKRSEDVRARLAVLSELPERWADALGRLRELAPLGDGPLENLLWQAVVGSWPASRQRLHAYAEKAAREAAVSTGWSDPDPGFEERMHALVDAAFDDAAVREIVESLYAGLRLPGYTNSLAAKLLQLTAPGVPDVYQGSELWGFSLVDPDNRRPVDYGLRERILGEIDAGLLPAIDDSGAAKLLVTHRALRLRRERPELFTGYSPVTATGDAAEHLLGFRRGPGGAIALVTRLPVGLEKAGGWGDTSIELTAGRYEDVLSARTWTGDGIRLDELFEMYPVALLVPERSA